MLDRFILKRSGLCSMQVSVLTDQVEAQGEKIRDLDLCLDEHREKLNATEEMLQQVRVHGIWLMLNCLHSINLHQETLTRSSNFKFFYQKTLLCSINASLP